MSGEFTVDPEQIDSIVARLQSLVGFIHENLDALDQQVSSLHSSSWSGAAAQAHADAHQQWATGAREFAEGVADMGTAAKTAHGQYTAAVQANTRMFKSR